MFNHDPNNSNTLGERNTDSERDDLDQNHKTPTKLEDSFAIGELTEDDIFNHRRPLSASVPVSPLAFDMDSNDVFASPITSPVTTPTTERRAMYIPQSEPKQIHFNGAHKTIPDISHQSPTQTASVKIPPKTEPKPFNRTRSRLDLDASGNRTKSLSYTDINDWNTMLQRRGELLASVKATCDSELLQFVENLRSQMAMQKLKNSEQLHEIYDEITHFAAEMTAMTAEDIIAGKCTQLVDQVQKLQQTSFTKKTVGRENVTRLLLIISRVSRLVEHLDLRRSSSRKDIEQGLSSSAPEDDVPSGRKKNFTISVPQRSKSKQFLHDDKPRPATPVIVERPTTPTTPKEKDTSFISSFFEKVKKLTPFDKSKKEKKSESKKEKRDSVEAAHNSHSSLPVSPVITKLQPATKSLSEQFLPLELLCRICEELVPTEELEEHSRYCALESINSMKASSCDDRIGKIIKGIERKVSEIHAANPTQTRLNGDDLQALEAMKKILQRSLMANSAILREHMAQVNTILTQPRENSAQESVRVLGQRVTKVLNEKYMIYIEIEKTLTAYKPNKPRLKDFQILKPINKGAYGKVFLAMKKTTRDLLAIKVLNKNDLRRKNQVDHIKSERDILASTQHPFLVRFYYSFQTKENLFLVMEYLNGGDLYALLKNLVCFDEEMTRMYIAEVILALEYLHSKSIIHRDLKPDNMLVAADGHIKLTDFGLSKFALYDKLYRDAGSPPVNINLLPPEVAAPFDVSPTNSPPTTPPISPHQARRKTVNYKRYSFVGTPDYLAPEVILGTGHGKAVDWWALGVILFEFLTGCPPFNAETPQQIFENILNRNIPPVRVPEEMSEEAWDLINKLLTVNPDQRLGFNGAKEVKAHPFFSGVNWDTILEQEAIFIPKVTDLDDTSYFDETRGKFDFSDEEDENTDTQDDFLNFSFKHLSNLEALNKKLAQVDSPAISPRRAPKDDSN